MSLDARVYCNCVERGLLRKPHPYPELLCIDEDGYQAISSNDLAQQLEHDRWKDGPPCAHEAMHAYATWLGNISGIGFLRNLLTPISARPGGPALPVLLDKVIYDGMHTGDFLTIEQVNALQEELRNLRKFDFKEVKIKPGDAAYINSFLGELELLIDASLAMRKPISL